MPVDLIISTLLNGWLTAFCFFSGSLLNLFSIFVFLECRRTKPPVIQYYLVTLTIWQTLLLSNAFLLYCLPTLLYGKVVATGNYVYLYPFAYALANITHTGSVWIVLALTIDRYFALCRPLTHRTVGKRGHVKRTMVIVSLMAVIFSFPRTFEIHVVEHCWQDIFLNLTTCVPSIGRTDLAKNQTYWTIYHIVLAMLFVTLVPCLVLLVLTLIISIALRSAIIRRESLCPSQTLNSSVRYAKSISMRREHKSNIMLVLVIVKFLISDISPTVADVLEHVVGNDVFTNSRVATLFVDFSNFLLVLNCSTNFWVFILLGQRFQSSCRSLLCSICGPRLNRSSISERTTVITNSSKRELYSQSACSTHKNVSSRSRSPHALSCNVSSSSGSQMKLLLHATSVSGSEARRLSDCR
ncbi:hypothetical protein AB6A40_008489 [Gnathostoma spinigerum]|uniref:G-protein coupled receptors family 1 profile domain-containing protein n=1 Tax=Gnathostoma spinigerum TaxID=75299 RepID=A0ABD6EZL9_9BILA